MKSVASLIIAVASLLLLASCSLSHLTLGLRDHYGQLSRDRMAHIVDALNTQDAAALRGMFTDYALAEYSAEIDEGVAYLLSLFPNGDVIWRDHGGVPHETGISNQGVWTTLQPSGYEVTSGGNVYSVFFADFVENENDPENVGIYALGAVLQTDARDSGPEAAFFSWTGLVDVDARSGGPPGIFIGDDGQLSHDRMAQIIAALNSHDAAALKGMFTRYAVEEHSTDLDDGLDDLFSYFPEGDVSWQESQGGSAIYKRVDGDARTVLLPSFYRVSSGGVDYRLFFADFTENTIDPDIVGLYAIGVVPAAEWRNSEPEAELYPWTGTFDLDASGHPGIFIPPDFTADARMEQIAAAVNSRDAGALKAMFSTSALERTTDMDGGLEYLLSLFPNGEITWTPTTDDIFPIKPFSTVEARKVTEGVRANYRISADGKDYRLFFAEVTVDELHGADRVGLNKLGVTPWIDAPVTGCSGPFFSWSCSFSQNDTEEDDSPAIYVPE